MMTGGYGSPDIVLVISMVQMILNGYRLSNSSFALSHSHHHISQTWLARLFNLSHGYRFGKFSVCFAILFPKSNSHHVHISPILIKSIGYLLLGIFHKYNNNLNNHFIFYISSITYYAVFYTKNVIPVANK